MSRPRRVTIEPADALTVIPLVPAATTPASVYSHWIATDLVIVNAPKPPPSMQLISPPVAVFEMAPAKVLQGAVRVH
jgi:hypothetical protein